MMGFITFANAAKSLLAATAAAAVLYSGVALDLVSFRFGACRNPIEYRIASIDPQFGLSEEELKASLADASGLWSTAAGKSLFAYAEDGELAIHLVYDERQQAAELGKVIEERQSGYVSQKQDVDSLRAELRDAKEEYAALAATVEKERRAYEAEVSYWNKQGGAPKSAYEELTRRRASLQTKINALNRQATAINSKVEEINSAVANLNALARETNDKVEDYNDVADEDFDQGYYMDDAKGKRIYIYEFTSETDLERVLAHEFGHALGIEKHTEDPESIMHSYNLGSVFALAADDVASLKQVCRLK
jgi:chaperonin cofactor prefoldin